MKTAHHKPIFHHKELKKCAYDLKIANINLGKGEKVNRINNVNDGLAKMMFTVSQKVKISGVNILGISDLLRKDKSLSAEKLNEC